MASVNLQVNGLAGVQTRYSNISKKLTTALERAINVSTGIIDADAKMICPVDTGTLRESIHMIPATTVSGETMGKVYTSIEYAPYVEFGTGKRGGGSYPYRTQMPLAYGNRAGQVAQPFLGRAFFENQALIKGIIRKAVENV
ncbi:MAG: hypothetical protein Q4E47_03315 [Candidatus Saccharibacteria bacterium]|nr:hypothetical protein [Candidatus Saccharibacteria bacterium]